MSQKEEEIISFEEITENDTDLKEQLLSILPNGDKLVNLALSIIERSKTVTSHDNKLSTEDILKALLNLHLTQIKRSNENIIFAMENAIKLNNLISSNVDDERKIEDGKNTIASINDTLSSMVNIYNNSINDETVVTIRELLVTNRQADTKYDNNEIENNKTVTAPVLFEFMREMKEMKALILSTSQKIDATSQKMDTTDKTIGTMAKYMSTVNGNTNVINSKVNGMNGNMKVINSKVDKVTTQIDDLETEFKENNEGQLEAYDVMSKRVDILGDRIDTIQQSNKKLFQWLGENISVNHNKLSSETKNLAKTIKEIRQTAENIKNTMPTRKRGLNQ